MNGTDVNLRPDATNFTGATSNVLGILSVSPSDAGTYHVTVTSALGYGSVISSNAALTIVPKVLLGEWFTNGTLNDLSHHTTAGTHDGLPVGASSYTFSTDVPPGTAGQSIQFAAADSGIAINNTANTDVSYTNTFDTAAFTVAFWAKDRGPFGGNWVAWVAKDGYNNDGEFNGIGWSVGNEAWSQFCTSMRKA